MIRKGILSATMAVALVAVLHPAAPAADTGRKAKERGILVAGVRSDTPPFGFVDPVSGEVVGIDVDLARAVAQRLGVPLKVRIVTPQTWIPYLLNGDVDLVAATVTRNPDRARLVDFSLAYFRTSQRILAKKGTVTRLEDLGGKKIGATGGRAAERNVRSLVPSASCYFFGDSGKAVEALRNGEIDALSASGSVLYGCLSSLPADEYEIPGSVMLSEDGFRIAVRKDDAGFLDLVNGTLAELDGSGGAKRIFDRWFGAREGEGSGAAAEIPRALGVVTRATSTGGRFLVLPIQGIFRPSAGVSIYDPQGNFVGEGEVAGIYEEETYIDVPGAPDGLLQPGFSAVMGYGAQEARKLVLSKREIIGQVVQANSEEREKIRRETARKQEREMQEREKYQEDMTKTRMYLDYQYSDRYYRFR